MNVCACGSESYRSRRTYQTPFGPVRIVSCTDCGLARDLLAGDSGQSNVDEADFDGCIGEEEYWAERPRMRAYFDLVSRYATEPGSMLDVGCNAGQLMEIFKGEGWTVKGIDADPAVATYARQRGLDVENVSFEEIAAGKDSFDLVSVCHALEHIPDIRHVLEIVQRILKPNGLLFVAVPNYGSRSELFFYGSRWPSFLPNQHIWYFNEKKLESTLRLFGFHALFVRSLAAHRVDKGGLSMRALRRTVNFLQDAFNDGNEITGVFRPGSPGREPARSK